MRTSCLYYSPNQQQNGGEGSDRDPDELERETSGLAGQTKDCEEKEWTLLSFHMKKAQVKTVLKS